MGTAGQRATTVTDLLPHHSESNLTTYSLSLGASYAEVDGHFASTLHAWRARPRWPNTVSTRTPDAMAHSRHAAY
jgi:hypothetical protein